METDELQYMPRNFKSLLSMNVILFLFLTLGPYFKTNLYVYHPAYPMGTMGSFPGGKALGA